MKVDFPQPESAATPIMIGVCPLANALREVAGRAEKTEGAGANAEAEATKRMETMNFMADTVF